MAEHYHELYRQTKNAGSSGLLQKYYEEFNRVPEKIAFGFAAYLLFMQATEVEQRQILRAA